MAEHFSSRRSECVDTWAEENMTFRQRNTSPFCVVLIDKKMLIIGNVCLGYSGGDGFMTAA